MIDDRPVRFTGTFSDLSSDERIALFERVPETVSQIRQPVEAIIARVRRGRDRALRELASELDGVELDQIEVPRGKLKEAFDHLEPSLKQAMERSALNIETFHRSQVPSSSSIIIEPGIEIRRRPDPISRVGVYAPGGRAAYPSSVLMGAIPARVAGVRQVTVCSPPRRSSGFPDSSIMAAAYLAGADRVFAAGGAGAIAAMCIGTETIPRVDKVVGPGNAYVSEAKLQLANTAAFDSPAGPSELLVIADNTADPHAIVREVLAQAEHDPLASVIVVGIGDGVASLVEKFLVVEIASAKRRDIIAQSLRERGAVISVSTVGEAVEISNEFAPEHLLLAIANPEVVVPNIRNAGTVFVGESSSVAFGDYMSGANHVLPTAGMARSYSGLSTMDFIRWTSFQTVSLDAAARLAHDVSVFATAEGLYAHAAAALAWAGDRR